MTAGAATIEKIEPAVLANLDIEDGMNILVNDAEYICTNVTPGCCTEQSWDVASVDSTCWDLKPQPKQNSQITTEALAELAAGNSASCIKWTSGYSWREGEQACSSATDDTMFLCRLPSLCKIMGPYSTTMYTNLAAIGGVGTTTALVGAEGTDVVWKDREIAIAKYDPTDPNNCYTSWTAGMTYPKGATLCDGIIYTCQDPNACGVYVPGASGSDQIWTELDGAEVPSSQEKTYEYYDRTVNYNIGDFAISRVDQQTYKCTNGTVGVCKNSPPAGSEYWTPLIVKALNPSDMPTVYGGWLAAYRYQKGYLVGILNTNDVYECTTESFC